MSNSTGTFTLVEYDYYNGAGTEKRMMVETSVTWGRKMGRCNYQQFTKNGEIFTRARFRAWLKKYSPSTDLSIADQLPTTVWWLSDK